MDIKGSLFKLEEYNPRLAQRIWELGARLKDPLGLLLGVQILKLNDQSVEVGIRSLPTNRDGQGHFHNWVLNYASEHACRLLIERFVSQPMTLRFQSNDWVAPVNGYATLTATLDEHEREEFLRMKRSGTPAHLEMSVQIQDMQKKNCGLTNFKFEFSSEFRLQIEGK